MIGLQSTGDLEQSSLGESETLHCDPSPQLHLKPTIRTYQQIQFIHRHIIAVGHSSLQNKGLFPVFVFAAKFIWTLQPNSLKSQNCVNKLNAHDASFRIWT